MFHNSSHTEDIHRNERGRYLADFVYGANDGIVTTFAVVSGATGGALASGVIIILGIANLIGDGISMGLSNFLSIRSRRDFERMQRAIEEHEVVAFPDKEKEEVVVILKRWGIPENRIPECVEEISKDKKRWVDLMMVEELHIIETKDGSPARHGLATSVAFLIAGSLPLIPYIFNISSEYQFAVSIIATGISLFVVGAGRTIVTNASWFRSGIEMLLVGGIASGAAFAVGALIKTIFNIAL